jgi:hypothetical protein
MAGVADVADFVRCQTGQPQAAKDAVDKMYETRGTQAWYGVFQRVAQAAVNNPLFYQGVAQTLGCLAGTANDPILRGQAGTVLDLLRGTVQP